jgi:RimJ/RimL family protein N-acetyltransferase
LIGAMGIHISQSHNRAELGYWIGVPYWNQGYCTEAARAVLRYGFETLGLNRIQARHLARNPASGRVMIKIGMRHEGTMRQAVIKWEAYEDIKLYAILRSEYTP